MPVGTSDDKEANVIFELSFKARLLKVLLRTNCIENIRNPVVVDNWSIKMKRKGPVCLARESLLTAKALPILIKHSPSELTMSPLRHGSISFWIRLSNHTILPWVILSSSS
jgi:hypothetical protein